MLTLFRLVEIQAGKIEIDGLDISKMGLTDLREKISIIPQEAMLFSGTIRTNLDPFSEHDDATLYDAMKRAWLVDQDQAPPSSEVNTVDRPGSATPTGSRFTLDTVVEEEGSNLCVLLSLFPSLLFFFPCTRIDASLSAGLSESARSSLSPVLWSRTRRSSSSTFVLLLSFLPFSRTDPHFIPLVTGSYRLGGLCDRLSHSADDSL